MKAKFYSRKAGIWLLTWCFDRRRREGEDSGSPEPGDGKNDTKPSPEQGKATTDTRAGRSVTKRLRATQASFFKPPSSLRRHQCRRSAGRAPLARAPLSSSLSSLFFTSLAPRASMAAAPTASGPPDHARVAILGVACRLPGSQDAPAFWSLLLEGGNAISRVPTERWESSELYDPVPGAPPPLAHPPGCRATLPPPLPSPPPLLLFADAPAAGAQARRARS